MDPTIRFSIRAPLTRADLPGLSSRVCSLLERSGASVALCDVDAVAADAVAVDALARLELAARRRGTQVRLLHASPELRALIAFMGLEAVLCAPTRRGVAADRTAGTAARSKEST
jgi:ABC-type transporter Mla MlaB component